MAYDEQLGQRVTSIMAGMPGLEAKKMFGGIGYLLHGNMACGVNKDDLIVRVGPDKYGETVIRPYARPFDITGRAMKGWVMVASDGLTDEAELADWVQMGVDFTLTLPPK